MNALLILIYAISYSLILEERQKLIGNEMNSDFNFTDTDSSNYHQNIVLLWHLTAFAKPLP